jgi:hypothetical protein
MLETMQGIAVCRAPEGIHSELVITLQILHSCDAMLADTAGMLDPSLRAELEAQFQILLDSDLDVGVKAVLCLNRHVLVSNGLTSESSLQTVSFESLMSLNIARAHIENIKRGSNALTPQVICSVMSPNVCADVIFVVSTLSVPSFPRQLCC